MADEADIINNQDSKSQNVLVLVYLGILLCSVVCLMLIGSSEWNHREEIMESYNQGFKLNDTLTSILIPAGRLLRPEGQKRLVGLTMFVTYVTLIAPPLLMVSKKHPADPIHNKLEDILEIHAEFSIPVVCLVALFIYHGAECLVLHAVVTVFTVLIDFFLIEYWFDIAMPTQLVVLPCEKGSKVQYFRTSKIGLQ